MKSIIAGVFAVLLGATAAVAEPMTPIEAATHLSKSIVQISNSANGKPYCTAWKIAPKTYATAGHCTVAGDVYVHDGDFEWAKVVAYTIGIGKKSGNRKPKDWGILHTSKEVESREPLAIACDYKPVIGKEVAFMGYGNPTRGVLGVGYISSMEIDDHAGDAEFMISTHVSGGSSGSPVIDLETGYAIGIVTEMVPSPRVGVIGTGVENIVEGLCKAAEVHVQRERSRSVLDSIPKEWLADPDTLDPGQDPVYYDEIPSR